MKKVISILLILIILGSAGYFAYQKFFADRGEGQPPVEEVVEPVEKEVIKLPPEFEHDKDRDGIEDVKEEELGTSDLEVDTDGDGISDKNEIEKWQTDPTKVDSDGDGYADLIEIINGYNPLGEGEL